MENNFHDFQENDKTIIALALFEILGYKEIDKNFINNKFTFINENSVNLLYNLFEYNGIITLNNNDKYDVNINNFTDLSIEFNNILKKYGRYSFNDIQYRLNNKKPSKIIISEILTSYKYNWNDINYIIPPSDEIVIIRFCNPNIIEKETDINVYVLEDKKLAKYNNGKWTILPPYFKYDYNPLSNKDSIIDGAIVTHWAEISEDDLKSWEDRFKFKSGFTNLSISCDEENEKELFDALLYSILKLTKLFYNFKNNPEYDKITRYLDILNDLILIINLGYYGNKEEDNNALDN